MTCEQIERDEVAEQYLSSRLSSAEQEAFEAHYFDCTYCQERLRVLEDARARLAREPGVAAPFAQPASTPVANRRGRAWRFAAAGLAAAAVILLAVRIIEIPNQAPTVPDADPSRGDVVLRPPQSAPPSPDPRLLAQIQPPRYEPLRLRANTTAAQREFQGAMELYVTGDYGGAAAGLRRALALDSSYLAATFYLAICALQENHTGEGVTLLQRVVATGESPYLEDAHFFLAKARLRQGDVAAARSELTRVIALEGDRRSEAIELLAQLP
jgi:TolA-binding protein